MSWVGVAARTGTWQQRPSSEEEVPVAAPPLLGARVEGRAYCSLPLPVQTGLPVHVNASFALSSNRRNIFGAAAIDGPAEARAELTGVGAARARWNAAIVRKLLPRAYGRLLEVLARCSEHSPKAVDAMYSLWPTSAEAHEPFGSLPGATLRNCLVCGR